jgi:hypothetical protein
MSAEGKPAGCVVAIGGSARTSAANGPSVADPTTTPVSANRASCGKSYEGAVRGGALRPGSEPIDVVGCCSTRIEIERPVVVVGSDLLAGADLEADGVDQCSECVAHHHEHVVRIAPRRSTSGDLCRGGITPPGLGRGQDGGTAP